ncbi:MAG: hypothetical protein IJT00_02455, partial [Lachnospiraceae bacterium]|nr:hypothetical protein [Lachnospiraceae bacterium]
MDNTITVVMEGNVGGRTSVARDFELTPTGEVLDISYDEDKEGDKHPPVASYPYCNSAIKPLVHVYDGEVLLHEKADYTISYKNNKNPYSFSRDKAPDNKTPVVIIKMKGNYSGEVRMYFGIEPLSLEGEGAYASPMGALIKDGKPVKVVPEVFYGLSKLKIGKDFIISSVKTAGTEYKNFDPAKGITVDKAGKYDVTLAGVNGVNGSRTGIYTGEIETTLEASSTKQPITKVSLGKNKTLKIDANGKEIPPDLIVKAGSKEYEEYHCYKSFHGIYTCVRDHCKWSSSPGRGYKHKIYS